MPPKRPGDPSCVTKHVAQGMLAKHISFPHVERTTRGEGAPSVTDKTQHGWRGMGDGGDSGGENAPVAGENGGPPAGGPGNDPLAGGPGKSPPAGGRGTGPPAVDPFPK